MMSDRPKIKSIAKGKPSKGVRALEDMEQRLEEKREESEILKARAAGLGIRGVGRIPGT